MNPEAERELAAGLQLQADAAAARPHFRAAARLWRDEPAKRVAALLLAGDVPEAITAARKGLQQRPNSTALRQLLADARTEVLYPPGGETIPPLVTDPRPARWASWGMFVVGVPAVTRWAMTRRRFWLIAGLALLTGAGLTWPASPAVEDWRAVKADVLLRAGNGLSYPPRLGVPVPRGQEVRVLASRGDWLRVAVPGRRGETAGWLPQAAVTEPE